ncbi:MAG: hypothetical protein WBG11_05750 [Methylocella sp.]
MFRGERIHAGGTTVPVRCRSNAAAEWAVRGIAIIRGSSTFAGSDAGGQEAAVVPTPIETCELSDVDPPAWRAHVPAKRRDE